MFEVRTIASMSWRALVLPSLALLALSGCPRPPKNGGEPTPRASPTPGRTPPTPAILTPPPTPYVPNRRLEVGRIFNGMQYRVTLETEHGTTATKDRNEPASYTAELTVKVKVPKPHHDLEEIKRLNEDLATVLPDLPAMLENSKVSPSFDELYRLKCAALQSSLRRLDNLLSRHNFFDCETLLDLQHPKTKRRALFIQADMDSDTDGSDSDRMPEIDGSSVTFQPFTSYRWNKRSAKPNSFIPSREAKVKQYENELAMGGAGAARKEELRGAISRLRTEISDLKKYSFLIAGNDPYIVLPGSMFNHSRTGAFTPAVGDYCVVIYGKKLFPAIIGDVGPSDLIGEASLRICQQINSKADADNRPVNDLKVTYVVFPGTAEKFDVPDLEKWGARCEKLLEEIGGHKGELMVWTDPTKPKPPPATPAPATPAPGTPAPATPSPPTPAPGTPSPSTPASSTPAPTTPASTTPKPATPVSATPKKSG